MTATSQVQPFRPFFFLSALDAIAGVTVWVLPEGDVSGQLRAVWHRQELLFGMAPAMLAGFLLTALPRWTGCKPVAPFIVWTLVTLWLAGRAAHALSLAIASPLAAAFIILLTMAAAYQVLEARDWRNMKVILLAGALAAGAAAAGGEPIEAADEFGTRLSIAALISLLIVLGGRIIPSLTEAYLGVPGKLRRGPSVKWIEAAATVSTAIASAAWVVAPTFSGTAIACLAAAVGQSLRLIQWRPLRASSKPAIVALNIGYAWIPAGFAFIAARIFDTGYTFAEAGVHAWTAGAISMIGLGVMSSMTRRHTGFAFKSPALLTAAYVFAFAAGVARIAAPFVNDMQATLSISAISWILAYGLFLAVFSRHLLGWPAEARRSISG